MGCIHQADPVNQLQIDGVLLPLTTTCAEFITWGEQGIIVEENREYS